MPIEPVSFDKNGAKRIVNATRLVESLAGTANPYRQENDNVMASITSHVANGTYNAVQVL